MLGGAIERVEDRGAGRTRSLREWQLARLAARAWSGVARPAREHEAVDHERVPARLEEVGEPNLAATLDGLLEDVVGGDRSPRRQSAPFRGDALDRPPELDLRLEELVAGAAVLAGL